MEKYYIALYLLGISNELIIKAITEYSKETIFDLFNGLPDLFLKDIQWLPYKSIFDESYQIKKSLDDADNILCKNKNLGIHTALYATVSYPKNLLGINNPPAILYYKGANPNDGFDKAIASVGTRTPSHFSFNAINYLIPQWVNEGFAIVSGLAAGVDRLSHFACLASDGKTIAVLAHGLDMIYPSQNQNLAQKILRCNGTLLSEYPVGTKPDKFRFINRNRIIVGLSKATVAIEFSIKSGTMHSINYSQELNRPVFCPTPGSSLDENLAGLKYILDKGIAQPIKNGNDYQSIIFSSGYSITQPALKARYLKQQYLYTLIVCIENDSAVKSILESLNLPYTSACTCIIDLYTYLLDFIQEKNYPIDNLINLFVTSIIESYSK